MTSLNISEIKQRFPDFLRRVESGEEIILEKSGKAIARVVPIKEKRKRRKLGQERGKIWMSEDFNEPLPRKKKRDR
ncbi:MAG: type II toxin-antitoxin system Phd/YefM family antitoxin [Candidatus Aminicenantes bacterium]|nr:type II toxin-antitoxin system Phd/YefM family antitoxin [Candidatus Aminicenantes bacterium]